MRNIINKWIMLAFVVTLLLGAVYVVMQKVQRISANDPQVQMAEDASTALSKGDLPDSVVPRAQVDIASSLAPFTVVYDDSGQVVASSGLLHGQPPVFPLGVFDYVRAHGEDRVTWQPEPGVRSATVVTRFSGTQSGFVMVGRSLREVEDRTSNLGILIGLGWVGGLVAGLVIVAVTELVFPTTARMAS